MIDVKDALTHKYGPLPGYAWAGIGALAIVVVASRHKTASASATPSFLTTPPQSAIAGGIGDGLGAAGGGSAGGTGDAGFVDPAVGYGDPIIGVNDPVPADVSSSASNATPNVAADTSPFALSPFDAAVASASSTSPDYGLIAAQLPLSQADSGYAVDNAVLANPAIDYGQLNAALGIPTVDQINAQINTLPSAQDATSPIMANLAAAAQPVYEIKPSGAIQVGTTETIRAAPTGKVYAT